MTSRPYWLGRTRCFSRGRCHRRRGRIFRTRLSCHPRSTAAWRSASASDALRHVACRAHRPPSPARCAVRRGIGHSATGHRDASLEVRLPSAFTGRCCAVRSRQLSHDAASTLSTCTVARPCGFSLTAESSTVPVFAWPVISSPAGVAGNGFRFGRRSHGSFAGFCLQPDVPGPCLSSVPHRLAALLCGSAAALMGFDPSQCCSGEPVGGSFRGNPPAVFSTLPCMGLCLPKDRAVCSIIQSADQSRLVDRGFWVFRFASRTVPTRRDRPLLPWTFPLPGLSGAIRVVLPNACRRGSRHLSPATGSRPYAGLDARLAARPIRS